MCSQTRPAPPRIIVCFTHNVQTCSSDHTFCTSSDLTVHRATPQRSTHHSHTPATYSHTCMNPTAELVRVKSSGGSTKVGGSTTADDTPSCVPDAVAHLVSVFQGDNSNCRSSRHVSPNSHAAQRHTAHTPPPPPPPRTHTLQMWENNPLFSKLLDPTRVIFIDDYPTEQGRRGGTVFESVSPSPTTDATTCRRWC